MLDDNFIKSQDFKDFFFRSKREEYLKRLQLAQAYVPRENCDEVAAKVRVELNFVWKTIMSNEGRRVVEDSGLLLLPEWDVSSTILFDTIRKLEGEVFST
jgi:hypothetical protein